MMSILAVSLFSQAAFLPPQGEFMLLSCVLTLKSSLRYDFFLFFFSLYFPGVNVFLIPHDCMQNWLIFSFLLLHFSECVNVSATDLFECAGESCSE